MGGCHRPNRAEVPAGTADNCSRRGQATRPLDTLKLQGAAVGKDDRLGCDAVPSSFESDARALGRSTGVVDISIVKEGVRPQTSMSPGEGPGSPRSISVTRSACSTRINLAAPSAAGVTIWA
jgi:hypothetical protein